MESNQAATLSSNVDQQKPQLTPGQKAVHFSFNPSQMPEINGIKSKAAELIDMFISLAEVSTDGEVKARLKLAQREVESASMRAVSAVTYHLV
jgi:hypothetical protein